MSNDIDVIIDIVMEPKLQGNVEELVSMAEKAGITKIKFGPLIPVGKATIDVGLNEYKKFWYKYYLK